jgi:hypothetical protein
MINKLHPSEALVEVEAFDAKFDKVDLHVEEVIGESTTVGESIYHYYVDANASKCETPSEGFVPRLHDNPNNLHMKGIFIDSITLASRSPLQTSSHVSNLFSLLEAPCKLTHRVSTKEPLIDYSKSIMMTFYVYICAFE